MESLGAYVAQRRRSLGLTQQALADSLGYSVQAISKFEKGSSQMDLSSLPSLASALSLSLDELLKEKEHQEGQVCSFAFDGKILAANLAYLRAKKGLTQNEAGALAHISARSLANYEKGLFLPSLSTVLTYLDYYGVSADDLFGKALAPIPEKPQAPRRHLWRWLTPVVASLVVAIVVASTSPFWFPSSKTDDGGDAVTSTADSSGERSGIQEVTTSYASDNIAEVTDVIGRVNNVLSATLSPGEYPLSVNVSPAEWYDDSKFSQIGWSLENGSSSDTDGAAIRTDAAGHAWYLVVKDACIDDGTLALKPYVMSRLNPSYHIPSSHNLQVTFTHSTPVFNNAADPIDDVISLTLSINGQSAVSGPAGSTFSLVLAINPTDWLSKKVTFGLSFQNPISNSFIDVQFFVPSTSSGTVFKVTIQKDAIPGDERKGRIAFVNTHTRKQSVFSNYYDIRCV
jgi:transcriptional regulator with XRE-family HTH domain